MQSGIYSVSFNAGAGAGSGVAIVDQGRIQGGDAGFIYRGRFQITEGRVTAEVEVIQHKPGTTSVVGLSGGFRLALAGSATNDGFDLQGTVADRPQIRIAMRGHRVTDLVS